MAKKSNRKSLSMSSYRHRQLQQYAEGVGRSMSSLVDDCLGLFFTDPTTAAIVLEFRRKRDEAPDTTPEPAACGCYFKDRQLRLCAWHDRAWLRE